MSKPMSPDRVQTSVECWVSVDRHDARPVQDDQPGDESSGLLNYAVLQNLRELEAAGTPDFLSEVIDLYFDVAPRYIQSMQIGMLQQDMVLVREAAHSLKGSSASIGAATVARLCRKMEMAGYAGDMHHAQELLVRIEAEFAQVKPALETERSMPVV